MVQKQGFLSVLILFGFFIIISCSSDVYGQENVDNNGNFPLYLNQSEQYLLNKVFATKAGNPWESVGPYGGDAYDIAICLDDPSIIFAGCILPYYSTDGGTSWQVHEQLYELSSGNINIVTAAPEGVFYAAGGNSPGHIMKSDNYGQTWDILDIPRDVFVTCITTDPSDANKVHAGIGRFLGQADDKIFVTSTNGGATWLMIDVIGIDPEMVFSDLDIDPENNMVLFASAQGGLGGGQVVASYDGGLTWSDRSLGLPTTWVFNAIEIAFGKVYLAGGQLFGSQNVGLWESENAGNSWINISTSFPIKAVNDVRVSPDSPLLIYAATEGDGIYFSIDGGDTWAYNTTGANHFAARDIEFDPLNAGNLYCGFLSMAVFSSFNSGITWEPKNVGINSMNINDIAVYPDNSDIMLASFEAQNSGGCMISVNGGATWNPAESLPGTRFTAVGISSDGTMYAWSNGPTTVAAEGAYRSTDLGANWFNTGPNIGPVFETEINDLEISQDDPYLIFLGGNNFGANGWDEVIYKTTDAGDTWDLVYSGPEHNSTTHLDIAPQSNDQKVYASFDSQNFYGGFLMSIDEGESWLEINVGIPSGCKIASSIIVDQTNPDILYGAAGGPTITPWDIYKSMNGGMTWDPLGLTFINYEGVSCMEINPDNGNEIYAGTNLLGVMISLDGGNNWVFTNENFPSNLVKSFSDPYMVDDSWYLMAATPAHSAFKSEMVDPMPGEVVGDIIHLSTQDPVEGADVKYIGVYDTYETTTNADGHYEIPFILAGSYTVNIFAEGYNILIQPGIGIIHGEVNVQDFELTAPMIGVNPLLVNIEIVPDDMSYFDIVVENGGDGTLEYHNILQFSDTYGEVLDDIPIQSQLPDGTFAYGCEYDGTFIWVIAMNSDPEGPHYICKFDEGGSLIDTYPQNIGNSGLFSLCIKDGFLYSGSKDGFYKIDPATGIVTMVFSGTLGLETIRALTYIPYMDLFLTRDHFSDIILFDEQGNEHGTLDQPGSMPVVSDITYDPNGDCLWLFSRIGPTAATMHQYDIISESLTGLSYDVPLLEGLDEQTAGGLLFTDSFFENSILLGGTTSEAEPGDKFFTMEIYPKWVTTSDYYSYVDPESNMILTLAFNSAGLEDGTILNTDLLIISRNPDVGDFQIPVEMKVTAEVGIQDEIHNDATVFIYPNPAKNQLLISDDSYSISRSYKIFDINGKMVAEIDKPSNQSITRINLLNWNKGVYSLVIYENETMVSFQKVIIL